MININVQTIDSHCPGGQISQKTDGRKTGEIYIKALMSFSCYKYTILFATEELVEPSTEAEFADVNTGWDAALNAVKELAESL